jgi:hypothetical protein
MVSGLDVTRSLEARAASEKRPAAWTFQAAHVTLAA